MHLTRPGAHSAVPDDEALGSQPSCLLENLGSRWLLERLSDRMRSKCRMLSK